MRAAKHSPQSETALSHAIGFALDQLGIPNERVQSGMARGLKGGVMRLAGTGTPDRWTAYGWLEVKTDEGELSDEQRRWHERARQHGVRVATVRSVPEAVKQVLEWKAEP